MRRSRLYLGCAVWSYQGWVGNFYAAKTKPRDFLSLYSQQFNTVEGNTTFYAVPQLKTIAKWKKETTANFKFCPKFHREITHQGLLKPNINKGLNFLQTISNLDNNLGLVFVQLPPSYSTQYLADLRQFLKAFKQYHLALEVRHLDWFSAPYKEQLNQMLKELNIAKVLLDTRPIYNSNNDPQANSKRRKPNVPLEPVITNNYAFVRFISHPEAQYNESYLQQWAIQVREWLKENITVYFFVHCPIEEHSPNTANYFKELLRKQGVDVDSISNSKISDPTQLSLFDL